MIDFIFELGEKTNSFILLLGFGFVTGLRHGIDLDHIAAITDITSSQVNRARGIFLATLYAFGHGAMVVLLGIFLLALGETLPDSVDIFFGKIVGITLIVLGIYVLYSIFRYGKNFKLKSRWMLVFDAIQFGYHKLLHNFNLSHYHSKHKGEQYKATTAFGIGLIHGVGAETPTQVAALAALVGIGGGAKGIAFLLLFIAGIFASNLAVVTFSSVTFFAAKKRNAFYITIGVLTAVFSLTVGTLFLFD